MKTFSLTKVAMGVLLTALVITGCKKGQTGPKGDTGPQGPENQSLQGKNNGYITGTITGTRRDGTSFTEPFSYTYYFGNSSGVMDSMSFGSGYRFSFSRSINDIFSSNYSSVNVNTTSKTATTGTLSINLGFEKSLGNNKLFSFSAYTSTVMATGLSYNSSTGLFSGNFNLSLSGFDNNTGNPATIVGSFQANLVEAVYIKKQEAAIKNN